MPTTPDTPRMDGLVLVTFGLVAAHLGALSLVVGIRTEHLVADSLLILLAVVGTRHAKFRTIALVMLPIWLTPAIYEALPLLLPLRGEVHVSDLHFAEIGAFGIDAGATLVTPAKWFQSHTHPILDLFSGAAYIIYLYVPIALVLLWACRDRALRAHRLAWAFLAVNLAAFATQLAWPAAPPWYVDQYGLGPAVMDAAPSAAGAARFDALLNMSYFEGFYGRSVNVFGAMPSLHVAYPVVTATACLGLGLRWFLPALAFALLVAFSAIYLNHHYVLDVIAGAVFALVAYAMTSVLQLQWVTAQRRLGAI